MGIINDLWSKVKEPKTDSTSIERLDQNNKDIISTSPTKHIICNGKKVEIEWDKVVLFTDSKGLGYDKKCYDEQKSRTPTMFVCHWDVCLSTSSMVKVTKERGLSVHFGIDNDGTIYQLLDTKEIAWHAKGVNTKSVGVEISNGVLIKYNDHYKKLGLQPRATVINDKIHGIKQEPYLDFYPEQVAAVKALTKALNKAHGIPFKVPVGKDGKMLRGVSDEVVKNTFKGVIGHYHVTTNKTDPGQLPLDRIVEELGNEPIK